jgi:Mrp family chromosome partitioning ATPase
VEIARGWGAEGSRVVLCDAGFEEPTLHDAAGLDNLEGISDALLFGTSFQRLGQPLSDGIGESASTVPLPNSGAGSTDPMDSNSPVPGRASSWS